MSCENSPTIYLKAGATERLQVVFKDNDGHPLDLTGMKARMQVRREVNDAEVLVELTSGHGITITPAEGRLDIVFASDMTPDLAPGNRRTESVTDIEVYDDTVMPEEVIRSVRLTIVTSPQVTQ